MPSILPFLITLGGAAAAAAGGQLNGYWGQNGYIYDRLSDYCDTGVKYVSLSFISRAPEHDEATGYPGTNFAAHCGGDYYYKNGAKSGLLSGCETMKQDIPYCQKRGVKVLMSIGGVWSNDADYRVSTEQNGRDFSDFLWGAFGPYNTSWTGPRPFDFNGTHNAVDGFDFDIEIKIDNKPYIAMVDRFRELAPNMFISAAPQCPLAPQYFYMQELIQKAKLDALFVQFYNNEGCDAVIGNSKWDDEFNFNAWGDVLAASDKSKDAKVFIGLQAVEGSSGYITAKEMQNLVCQYQDKSYFGGVSLWDMTLATANKANGKSYVESAVDVLRDGCKDSQQSTISATTSTAPAPSSLVTSLRSQDLTPTSTASTTTLTA